MILYCSPHRCCELLWVFGASHGRREADCSHSTAGSTRARLRAAVAAMAHATLLLLRAVADTSDLDKCAGCAVVMRSLAEGVDH